MNRVILMGRLTRDPEVRYSQGERSMAIARYTLAVDRRGRARGNQDGDQGQTADFINIVAFDRAGEFAEKYFRQGMRVLVSGRIQTGSYTNREGQRVYTTDVIVDDQEFADSKNSGSGDSGGYGYQPTSRPAPSSAIGDGFMNIPDGVEDEGLPFN
jgi:single-strand DNA-binding protein